MLAELPNFNDPEPKAFNVNVIGKNYVALTMLPIFSVGIGIVYM